jgi:hypothetical protein
MNPTSPYSNNRRATYLLRGIPRDMFAQFKATCARRGEPMRAVLLAAMRQHVLNFQREYHKRLPEERGVRKTT